MIGIYQITNKINNNAYIGLSINIQKRFKDHIYRATDECGKEYDKVLYKAFRKYGIDNFKFEVIEECPVEKLQEREKYWIKYYDTYHNGYNCSPGGEVVCEQNGEKHHNHKLTEKDVRYIRELWASKTVSTREIYLEFASRIGKSGFRKICQWETWKKILPELNTQENRNWHRKNISSYKNNQSHTNKRKLTNDEVIFIRKLKTEKNMPKEVWKKYFAEKIKYDGFKDVWYKRSYKDVI